MRVARVLTNETCNQNCSFCSTRRSEERPEIVQRAAVEQRIDAAADDGATELTFAGGEPTLRSDLEELALRAQQRGVASIAVETNAATIDRARAQALAAAGVGRARVKLLAWGQPSDAITRDPGGFEATLAGARALADAGMKLEVILPVVRANAEHAAAVPEALARAGLPVEQITISVPDDAPHERELLDLPGAAAVVEAIVGSARRSSIAIRIDPRASLPPCVFPEPGRVAHLFALGPGGATRSGFSRVEGCAECSVADRCPGIAARALARSPGVQLQPIRTDRIRRRLSVIASAAEQAERELVTREICRRPDGSAIAMHTVRVNFHCNQSCHFCFVSTHLPPATGARIEAAIREAGTQGALLALSGGEPTLNPRLGEYVRLGKACGVREIELQTNAIRLAEPGLARELVTAGADVAFVSFHGPTAEISDAVTNAPGTFERTCRGIHAAVEAGLRLRLNFVFCEINRDSFPDVVRMVAEQWPSAMLSVSFVASSSDLVPRERWLIPKYSDVLPKLAQGLALARELGVGITGFESMCGLPLCLVPEGLDEYRGLPELAAGLDGGEFVKAEPCGECALANRCWGLRRGYAELYGSSELRPVAAAP